MNANQEAKLRMYRATENYCNENAAIVASNVAFKAAFDQFAANIAAIIASAQTDNQPLTGITVDKNVYKQVLCERAASVAALIYAYAATVGNNTLKAAVNFPVSDLTRMREDSLPPRCQNIHDAGEANVDALADYGVTKSMLADLQTAIDQYAAETPKPRTAISQRKTNTANLAGLFDQTDQILKDRMDKLVNVFKPADPDFVRTYESTRRIVKPPHTTTQLKGEIADKQTGAPIKNVSLTATPVNPENPTVTAAADTNGEYLIKPIAHGAYSITVTATGYNDFQEDIDVLMGEVNDFDVEMEK